MATEYLIQRGPVRIRVVHAGVELITGEGDDAVVQSFDDDHAARAHLDHMLSRRRREGYAITARDIGDVTLPEPDAFGDLLDWDPAKRRLRAVFREDTALAAQCEAITATLVVREPVCLQILCDPVSPGTALSSALTRRPAPSVQRMIFDTYFQTVTRQRDNSPGDVAAIVAAMPNLAALFLTGNARFAPIEHNKLRALHLLCDPMSAATLAALQVCHLPALERLALCVSRDDHPPATEDVVAAVRGHQALRHIDLRGLDDVVDALTALTDRPLPAAWTMIALDGMVVDEDALLALLEQRGELLRSLKYLGLPLLDNLSPEASARAEALLPGLRDIEALPDVLSPAIYDDW